MYYELITIENYNLLIIMKYENIIKSFSSVCM